MTELFSGKGDLIELKSFALAELESGDDGPHIDTTLLTHSEIACQLVHHVMKSGGRISLPCVIQANRTAAPGFIYINDNSAISEHASSSGHSALWTWLSAKGFSMGLMLSSQGESAGPVTGFSGRHDAFLANINLDQLASAVGLLVGDESHKVPLNELVRLITEPNDYSRWLMWPQPRAVAPTFHFPEEKYTSHSDADGYSQWLSTNGRSACYAIVKNFTFSPLSEPTFDIEVKKGGLSHDFQLVKSMGSLLLLDYVGEVVHPGSNGYMVLLKACVTAAKRYWRDSNLQNGSNIG
ncbi:hypothetical protein [Buttiauxella gaviniae]|uniref:hypothetical protein n=1 Tax=Buttiauxella gaviniae TaxID=82990 RepID=UPI0039AEE7EB